MQKIANIFFFLSTIKMTAVSHLKRLERELQNSSHPPHRILFFPSPLLISTESSFSEIDHVRKNEQSEALSWLSWTRDGRDKSLKYLLGANFRKNNTIVEKALSPPEMPSTFE